MGMKFGFFNSLSFIGKILDSHLFRFEDLETTFII